MFTDSILVLLTCNVLIVHCYTFSFLDFCSSQLEPDPFSHDAEKSSGNIVMSKSPVNGSWYLPDLNCSVTFSAEGNYLLLLTFSNVSLRNNTMDNLIVEYDNLKSSAVLSGQQVCSNENCENLKFYSGDFHNITLKFLTYPNITVPQNMTGFRAHYTVYELVGKNGCRDKNQFLCDNKHCIWNELRCDGHNNCGDRSDETGCSISVRDTVWGIVIIVLAILSVVILVPIFICLATYGTKNIVKSMTLSNNSATPLVSATDCGETSGLLTSSDVINNCWPGTSYERSNSFSYGTSQPIDSEDSNKRKLRSVSVSGREQSGKIL